MATEGHQPRIAIPLESIGVRGTTRRPGERRLTLVKPAPPEPAAHATLREEVNAYLEERTRLRAEGLLPNEVDGTTIITPADAISLDLFVYDLELGSHPEGGVEVAKWKSVSRIRWGFDALAFRELSKDAQESAVVGYEFGQGFLRNYPYVFEEMAQLNGEETAILTEQLAKVGIPFKPQPQGITIPFAPTVEKMREIVGGEPLFPHIPLPNLTHIKNHPRRKH